MISLRTGIAWLCTTSALVALSACSQTSSADSPATTQTAPVESVAPVTETPTTIASTTEAPTTEAPTTAVPTTEAPTTTAAPTTTVPPNLVVVGVAPFPIAAVGKSNGPDTVALQDRLTQLGFWSGLSDGQYGFATLQAVMAFQKYIGLPATGKVDDTTAQYLTAYGDKAHGTADSGTLVEVDKAKQLLFIVVDGQTLWTFNTSTGSGIPYEAHNKNDPTKIETGDAVTPNGLWKTTRERPEGWWEGDLGKIYRPKYFHGGVAIHGMTSVPNYPASHGCVRLSTQAMDFVWDSGLVPLGTPVWVHE
jgi:peptidoglycan hydrolase-like protein with peptidoglycan-binding domain